MSPPATAPATAPLETARPVLRPGIPQFFLPVKGAAPAGRRLAYEPALFASAQVRFTDARSGVDALQTVNLLAPVADTAVPVDWSAAADCAFGPAELEAEPAGGAAFGALAAAARKAASYDTWRRSFVAWVAANRRLALWRSESLGMVSSPGEEEGAFRVRLQQAARERRDEAVAALREQYGRRFAQLQEKLRRAEDTKRREESQASSQKVQTAISFGATLLGAVLGRKAVSAAGLGRATTAARGMSRTMKESADVRRAAETVEGVRQQIAGLEAELASRAAALESSMTAGPLQALTIAPRRTGITVQVVALVWVPYWA